MHVVQNKSAPAYNGARFDAGGFCVAHSDIRLSRLINGKYKIVRKICFKCGSATLMNNGHSQKTKLHDYRKKSNVPSEVITAGNSIRIDAGRHAKRNERRNSREPPVRAERRNIQDPHARKQHSNSPACKGDSGRRRGRTISPLRKSLPKNSNRPSSWSGVVKKKVTDEKIKELMHLMPPLYRSSTKAHSSTRDRQSSGVKGSQNYRPRQPVKPEMPFDGNGYCRAHPEVRLAKKNPKGDEWEIVSGVCPQCCVSAAIIAQKNINDRDREIEQIDIMLTFKQKQSSTIENRNLIKSNDKKGPTRDSEEIIGKLLTTRSDGSHQTWATSPSSSHPSTPESISKPAFSDDYFTCANRNIIGMALDIYQGERMVAELNKSCASETTTKHRNAVKSVRTRNKAWDLSPSREPPGRRFKIQMSVAPDV